MVFNEKVIEHSSFIACNFTIVSNKQRPKYNTLAKIQRAKLKGAREHSRASNLLKPRTQVQTLGPPFVHQHLLRILYSLQSVHIGEK